MSALKLEVSCLTTNILKKTTTSFMSTRDRNLSGERWKEVDFHTSISHPKYEVSNLGRVRSYAVDEEKGRIITGSTIKGYKAITVKFAEKKTQAYYVHRLVAEAFLDKSHEEQYYVIHLDYDKSNNNMHNLRWASEKEVNEHNANNPRVIKRKVTGYKLTENDVRVIKKLLRTNKTRLSMIAKRFGITHTQLNRIRSGENWGHVKVE